MTSKRYFWSYRNVTDFLKENDFSFSEGLDGSEQTWVKLGTNGEPATMMDIKFTRGNYSKKEITRIIRVSGIPEQRWVEWIEAGLTKGPSKTI